jgi:hypothetical protein
VKISVSVLRLLPSAIAGAEISAAKVAAATRYIFISLFLYTQKLSDFGGDQTLSLPHRILSNEKQFGIALDVVHRHVLGATIIVRIS